MKRRNLLLAALMIAGASIAPVQDAQAASAAELEASANTALEALRRDVPGAGELMDNAKGVLVFPNIVKAGLGVGGQFGEGVLRKGGSTAGYYNTVAASIGWQIGAQSFSQVMLFMTDDALAYLDRTEGFEVGADISAVVANEGVGADLTSSQLQPIIAYVFGQQGLMAGISLEGSKITKIDK